MKPYHAPELTELTPAQADSWLTTPASTLAPSACEFTSTAEPEADTPVISQ